MMPDLDDMSRSELWGLIKKLKEEGAEIDVAWGSKDEMIEALKKYYDSPIEDDDAEIEDGALYEEEEEEYFEISSIDDIEDDDVPVNEGGGAYEVDDEGTVDEDIDYKESDEIPEEVEPEDDYEPEVVFVDDDVEEAVVEAPKEVVVFKQKIAPKKAQSYTVLSNNTDVNDIKIGTFVKFKCSFYRGSQQQYATGGLIVKKFGGVETYVGKLTGIIRKWIRTKRIKVVRWN